MSGIHTNRHHVGLSFCVKALIKAKGIQVPENISQAIPDWFSPNGTGSSARHESRPDVIFVRSIPGRQAHLDPFKIPPQDRGIHLVELKFCPDTNPYVTFKTAATQHAHTITGYPQLKESKQEQQGESTHHPDWCGWHCLE
eukprot:294135-Pelagomonas_calceolata.AAC.1